MTELSQAHCRPLSGAQHRLDTAQALTLLEHLEGWQIDGERLLKEFRFADFKSTMLFVNTLAFLAENENHHPLLEIGYGRAEVIYRTHDVGGLSRNDFVCAAKIEALIKI
jgi:4a-hydroxytetrahydrobiopterin dehydratase